MLEPYDSPGPLCDAAPGPFPPSPVVSTLRPPSVGPSPGRSPGARPRNGWGLRARSPRPAVLCGTLRRPGTSLAEADGNRPLVLPAGAAPSGPRKQPAPRGCPWESPSRPATDPPAALADAARGLGDTPGSCSSGSFPAPPRPLAVGQAPG